MDPARIAELLRPFFEPALLSPTQLHNISTYIDLLLRWNSRINLTSVRDPEQIVTRHFGESLFAARLLFPRPASAPAATGEPNPASKTYRDLPDLRDASGSQLPAPPLYMHRTHRDDLRHDDIRSLARPSAPSAPSNSPERVPAREANPPGCDLIDIGSGAGFPGLPVKIWAPLLSVTLIESQQKKAAFLREAIRRLTLTSIDVFSGRAETFGGSACVVTLRAVERFEAILPAAVRLVAPSGRLSLLIGESQLDRARELLPSLTWSDPVAIPLSASRFVLIGSHR